MTNNGNTDQLTFIAKNWDTIPPLAWLFERTGTEATFIHGTSVEIFDNGFFEGAWDGPFVAHGFAEAANVFGSGTTNHEGAIRFVTPAHSLEGLYYLRRAKGYVVSNSLVYLLTFCGGELTPHDWTYGRRFAQVVRGLSACPIEIPSTDGEITFFFHHNFDIGDDGSPNLVRKPLPPRFETFDDYYTYLTESVARVCANAADPARLRRYRPLTTLSSGYDSATCAVLAKQNGCKTALGILSAQRGASYSGEPVARALGLEFKEFARPNFETAADARAFPTEGAEAEFLASGNQGEDFPYAAFGAEIPGTVLFTGFLGGIVWPKDHPAWQCVEPMDGDVGLGDFSGKCLGELRLMRDFFNLPIPFIGCQRFADLYRISNAPEMAAYSIGGDYDRPIPRRIVETAGVKREDFGQQKRAVSAVYFDNRASLSQATLREIDAFARNESIPLSAVVRYQFQLVRWTLGLKLFYVTYRLRRINRLKKYWLGRLLQRLGVVGDRLVVRVFGKKRILQHYTTLKIM